MNGPFRASTGALTVLDSTINSNTNAGGIDSEGGILTVVNSTITSNVAANGNHAGGIGVYGGSASITSSTIAGNSGNGTSSGGLDGLGQMVTVFDTIVAGNSGGSGSDTRGTFNSRGHNLIGNVTSTIPASGTTGFVNGMLGDQVGTSAAPINPQLRALKENGGPTPTEALLGASPAIGAGDDTSTSHRSARLCPGRQRHGH